MAIPLMTSSLGRQELISPVCARGHHRRRGPGLVPLARLLELVRACADYFPEKVVLITNGLFPGALDERARLAALAPLEAAGLTVLSLSRHHAGPAANARIMGLDVGTEDVLASVARAGSDAAPARSLRSSSDGDRFGAEALERLPALGGRPRRRRSDAEGALRLDERRVHLPRPRGEPLVAREPSIASSLATALLARARGWRRIAELPWGAPIPAADVAGSPATDRRLYRTEPFWERTAGWRAAGTSSQTVPVTPRSRIAPAGSCSR